MKKVTIKDVLTSDNWIITQVMQGYNGRIRINAKPRYHIADGQNFFSEWCCKKYADSILMNEYGRKLSITNY